MAERFALSSYDAAYLELAQRYQLPLASLDQDLRAAAATLGITVLGN
jgi:predicted nucleic acid-binding protein